MRKQYLEKLPLKTSRLENCLSPVSEYESESTFLCTQSSTIDKASPALSKQAIPKKIVSRTTKANNTIKAANSSKGNQTRTIRNDFGSYLKFYETRQRNHQSNLKKTKQPFVGPSFTKIYFEDKLDGTNKVTFALYQEKDLPFCKHKVLKRCFQFRLVIVIEC